MNEKLFAVIGHPLTHSFSPHFFNTFFTQKGWKDYSYVAIPILLAQDIPSRLQAFPKLKGFNVTLPHKKSILPYLYHCSPLAIMVGAVNCVAIKEQHWFGHNTDVIGFTQSLQANLKKQHTQALILGDGGAAAAVKVGLQQLHIPYKTVVRNKKRSTDFTYQDVDTQLLQTHHLLINTTPLGMPPHEKQMPELPYDAINSQHLLFDLIYNPEVTLFLKEGIKRGAQVINGQGMLETQALASWDFWKGYF